MKWSMLWDLAVHNTSLPFDHTCCLDKSELETCLRFPVKKPLSKATIGVVLSLSSSSNSEIPQLVRCHYQLVPHLDSEISSCLRAHCSAVLVPRLLTIVYIVGLCGFHFSVEVEIENVVFEIDWNEFVLSMPVHQLLRK